MINSICRKSLRIFWMTHVHRLLYVPSGNRIEKHLRLVLKMPNINKIDPGLWLVIPWTSQELILLWLQNIDKTINELCIVTPIRNRCPFDECVRLDLFPPEGHIGIQTFDCFIKTIIIISNSFLRCSAGCYPSFNFASLLQCSDPLLLFIHF